MSRKLLIFMMMLLPPMVSAESYWVSLASFPDEQTAEAFRDSVASEFIEPLRITEAETDVGYYFRVMLGPFGDRDQADRALRDAHRDGRQDAWIVMDDPSKPIQVDDEQWRAGSVSPQPVSPGRRSTPQGDPAAWGEPPEGYNAHKLHRDESGSSGPPG